VRTPVHTLFALQLSSLTILTCRTVYVTIASAFGVSLATENTFVSQNIGKLFIDISLGIGGKVSR